MSIPRLSDKEFLILEMLVGSGELYGLEMVKKSNKKLKRGTIYVTLSRMADKGYVESRQEEKPDHVPGIPRRLYSATGLGQRIFHAVQLSKTSFGEAWA